MPQHLHYVPNSSRKPWEVDLLFCGNMLNIGENALYATLLDLQRKGFTDIEASKNDVALKIACQDWDREPLEDYEKNLMRMISTFGEDGVLSFRRLEKRLERDRSITMLFAMTFRRLMRGEPWTAEYAKKFLVKQGLRKYATVALVILFFGLLLSFNLNTSAWFNIFPHMLLALGGLIMDASRSYHPQSRSLADGEVKLMRSSWDGGYSETSSKTSR